MALESAQTVFGFGCTLDWRPTVFVNGIPSNRVCSACGLVPSNIALLPCRHLLCKSCYDRCASNGSRCCLDGEAILADDVLWSATSTDSILGRNIRCWNSPLGCGVTGPVSEVLQHFNTDCEHHTVTCPCCRGSVAHKDIVNHLASGVCGPTSGTEIVAGENVDSGIMGITSALSNLDAKVSLLQRSIEENLESMASGSVRMLAQEVTAESPILESVQCLENTLTEGAQLCRCALDDARATLQNDIAIVASSLQGIKDEFGLLNASLNQTFEEKSSESLALCTNIKRSIDRLETAVAGERKQMREKLGTIEKIMQDRLRIEAASVSDLPLERRLLVSKALEWSIEPWSEAKMESHVRSSAFVHPPHGGYFYGYHIRPCALVKGVALLQSLLLGYEVCRGECDQLVTWPMKKNLRITLLHPERNHTNVTIVQDCISERPGICAPYVRRELTARWLGEEMKVKEIEGSHYLKDNKISLRFEVL
ncbi:TNF receptor-associated factor 3-like [Haemaphysalis longicornis]